MYPSTSSAIPNSAHLMPSWAGEHDAQTPAGYQNRRAVPIKRNDAELLTREDVQYDLLDYLFTDRNAVFTQPSHPRPIKVTFGDLYIHTLYNSSKCSKVLRDKMQETPAFRTEFAKLALLTNVGRINTTMAFFPEMKTALRTYHPVPSLQKTDGNAQDAPRIKNCLKAALLHSESNVNPPSTTDEILQKLKQGHRPPTSIANLIFVLAGHAAPLPIVYFEGQLHFIDLFLPGTYLASVDRARAILWILYHHLENDTGPNPFDDRYTARHIGRIPTLRRLTQVEYDRENVDTREEIEWANMMAHRRNVFLQELVVDSDPRLRPNAHYVTESGNNLPRSQRQLLEEQADGRSFLFYVPRQEESEPARPQQSYPRSSAEPARTMYQQAWHTVSYDDPLIDSDDEDIKDYHTKVDITRRLEVLARIQKHQSRGSGLLPR